MNSTLYRKLCAFVPRSCQWAVKCPVAPCVCLSCFWKTCKLCILRRVCQIDEVSVDKERLLEEKRHLLENKMDRAEEKRRLYLQGIVNKAHDEDNKGREIAFINGLEAQNKLHDLLQQHQVD